MAPPDDRPEASAPDISFVASLYRSARYLPQFLRLLERMNRELQESSLGMEAIVVANDADRRERRLLESAVARNDRDEWLTVLNVPRELIYASWNRGVAAARADIIGFWNVDDIRNPAAVVEGVRLVRQGHRLVAFPWVIVKEVVRGRTCVHQFARFHDPDWVSPENAFTEFVVGPFFIFDRSLSTEYGPFDEQFHIVGDYDWQLRLAPNVPLVRGQSLGGVFLSDGANLSSTGSDRLRVEQNVLFRRHHMAKPEWPLDSVGARLLVEYDVERICFPGAARRCDFSYDQVFLRRRRFARIYSRLRSRVALRTRIKQLFGIGVRKQ